MDIVDFILLLIRYTPLLVLVILTGILVYLQVREARSKQHYYWYGSKRKSLRH